MEAASEIAMMHVFYGVFFQQQSHPQAEPNIKEAWRDGRAIGIDTVIH